MILGLLSLLLRALVVLAGTGMATFALLWHAPGDPAQTIAMARHRSLLSQDIVDEVRFLKPTVGFFEPPI